MAPRVLITAVLLGWALQVSSAPLPRDHNLLRTLQSLSETSLQKRMADLAAMGPESYRHLREIAFDSKYSPEVRAEAFGSVVTLGKQRSRPEIDRASSHDDWFMRVLALSALQSLDSEQAQSLARQLLLEDPALMVRASALNHIDLSSSSEYLEELLLQALNDEKNFHRGESLWIRSRLASALLTMNLKPRADGTSPYEVLLKDRDPNISGRAVKHLRQTYPKAWSHWRSSSPEQEISKWVHWLNQPSVPTL